MHLYSGKEIDRVLGPYEMTGRNAGRKFVILMFTDGSRKSTSLARWTMEQHLGRELRQDEHVDHANDDFTDDQLQNLQILTQAKNNAKAAARKPRAKQILITCIQCTRQVWKAQSRERFNAAKRKAGPFCNKQCSWRWQKENGVGGGNAKQHIEWPSHDELTAMVEAHGKEGTGRLLGVSGQAVRARLKKQARLVE